MKTEDYPGPGLLLDFFRKCVKKGLEARGIDPENHYKETFTNKETMKMTSKSRAFSANHMSRKELDKI